MEVVGSEETSLGIDAPAAASSAVVMDRRLTLRFMTALSARVVDLLSRVGPDGRRVVQLTPTAVATLLWAQARTGLSLPMFSPVLTAVPDALPSFDAQLLSLTLWALVKANAGALSAVPDPEGSLVEGAVPEAATLEALSAVVAECKQRDLRTFHAQSVALLAYGLSHRGLWADVVLGAAVAPLVMKVAREVASREDLKPSHVAVLSVGLGRVHGEMGGCQDALNKLVELVCEQPQAFSVLNLRQVLYGLVQATSAPEGFKVPTHLQAVLAQRLQGLVGPQADQARAFLGTLEA